MQALQAIFPAQDFSIIAAIIGLPLVGALVNGVFGKRLGKQAVTLMALAAVGASFVASLIAFALVLDAAHGEQAARLSWHAWTWMTISGRVGNSIPIEAAFSMDALSATMALIVTGIGFLIHLYSTKYMESDPGYHRFFAYLNLFIFSMLVLILGDNLPVLFVGWEGVGLCSYLLIGFWYDQEKNAAAGKKAFIANRIGDFGLLVAMGFLVHFVGGLSWNSLESSRGLLLTEYQVWPIGSHLPFGDQLPSWLEVIKGPYHVSVATIVALALFLGCAGKSAQIPLYVWLPDAMAGPTPVSALIHAATMVTAGVYLVCRLSFLFVLSPAAMFFIALTGACTALLAATIALVQNDIKKVLAYSTVSQLGYMFLGVGVGAFVAGFFHVITHAFFKACLFLGAGSVIHAIHVRIHDTDASQDVRNMGGLMKFMPTTFWTFMAAWAAIVGLPLTSGFFSKDEILFKAWTSSVALPTPDGKLEGGMQVWGWPEWGPGLLYALGVIAAVLTAFYMTRLVILTFFGEFRGWTIVRGWKPAPVQHAGQHDEHDEHEHHHEPFVPGEPLEGPKPHESAWQMTAPLVILGALSIVGGLLSAHVIIHSTPLDHLLDPVFKTAAPSITVRDGAEGFLPVSVAIAVLAFAAGVGIAYWMYLMQKGEPARLLAERFPALYQLVYDKWRVDEAYDETVIGAVDSLAEMSVIVDKWVVDGIASRLTSGVVAVSGTVLRYFQTGRVQAYAATMVVGLGGLGWYLFMPHASATVKPDLATGKYEVTAAPGFGYQYRWDADGDGKWDGDSYGSQQSVAFSLEPSKKKTLRLEVKNAFGRTASSEIEVERPKIDATGPGAVIQVDQGADGVLRALGIDGQRLQQPGEPSRPSAPKGAAP